MLNRDKLNNANPAQVARASFATIDALQMFEPHEQVMALAAAFVTVCDHLKLPAQDAFTTTKNLMNEKQKLRAEFTALQDYVQNELPR